MRLVSFKTNHTVLINNCITILADRLSINPQRIRDHAFAQAVLSAFWSLEDLGSGWDSALELATLLKA